MKIDTTKISKLIKEANSIKENVAKERDRLRDISSEIDDVVMSLEQFEDEFTQAMDTLSQYV